MCGVRSVYRKRQTRVTVLVSNDGTKFTMSRHILWTKQLKLYCSDHNWYKHLRKHIMFCDQLVLPTTLQEFVVHSCCDLLTFGHYLASNSTLQRQETVIRWHTTWRDVTKQQYNALCRDVTPFPSAHVYQLAWASGNCCGQTPSKSFLYFNTSTVFCDFRLVGRDSPPRSRTTHMFRLVSSTPEPVHSDQGISFESDLSKSSNPSLRYIYCARPCTALRATPFKSSCKIQCVVPGEVS